MDKYKYYELYINNVLIDNGNARYISETINNYLKLNFIKQNDDIKVKEIKLDNSNKSKGLVE